MWLLILKSFYFTLPAYLANMSPVIFDKLGIFKFLKKTIDGGRKIRGDYIFGSGKTWRGIVSGAIFGVLAVLIQSFLHSFDIFENIAIIDYSSGIILFGLLAGLGAILGDLTKSFFKRRFKIKSGRPWPIFDQLDFIVGFILFTYFIATPPIEIIITIFLITLILHPLTNLVSYFLGIKKVWW